MPGSRVVAALERHGFKLVRVNGSHHIMRHPTGVVPQFRCIVAGTCPKARYGASSTTPD